MIPKDTNSIRDRDISTYKSKVNKLLDGIPLRDLYRIVTSIHQFTIIRYDMRPNKGTYRVISTNRPFNYENGGAKSHLVPKGGVMITNIIRGDIRDYLYNTAIEVHNYASSKALNLRELTELVDAKLHITVYKYKQLLALKCNETIS